MIAMLLAGGVSTIFALVATPLLIRWLQARGIGAPLKEELEHAHARKAGLPTMGGLTIVGGALLGYMVGHVSGQIFTWGGIGVIVLVLGAAATGFVDDWIKVHDERNVGMTRRAKSIGQVITAIVFFIIVLRLAHVRTNLSFTRWDSLFTHPMPTWVWVVWAFVIIYATTNGVNFSDGFDGLAAGSSIFALSAFVVIGFWQFRHPAQYGVPQALDLALVAISMMGGCVGFLWWNAAPARIIMGDTGALGIGAGIAGLALTMNVHLLLPVITGLFVIEWVSDIIQIVSFRFFHKRVFKMAPIHHHFELSGWPETTVVIRFWILAGLFAALALGLFYADWIALGVAD